MRNNENTDFDKLCESEQMFRGTFENAAVGISHINLEGIWIRVNQRLCDILGYTKEELSRISFQAITYPEDLPADLSKFEVLMRGELEHYSLQKRYIRKDGQLVWVYVTRSLQRDSVNKSLYSITIIQDISALKAGEQKLTENQHLLHKTANELKGKNEELETIINIASHDLRSPVVNIMGFSGELARSINELKEKIMASNVGDFQSNEIMTVLNTDIPQELSFIEQSTHSIDQMLRSLLKVSHIVLADINSIQIDMNDLLENIVRDSEKIIKENKIELTIEPLPNCQADRGLIKEVFFNLINNAIKYLDPTRPGKINIRGFIKNQYSIYSVEDNGRGIALNHQKNIFKLFHRLDTDSPTEGVGLTIVRRLLNRMDGNVWLESQQGKGSKFFVALPVS